MAEKRSPVTEDVGQTPPSYTKAQLVESNVFGDFAEALLSADETYTIAQVQEIIKNYMESAVK